MFQLYIPDGGESPYKSMGTRFCVHIVFVASAASKNVNEKIKTQTSSPPFVGGYMHLPQIIIPDQNQTLDHLPRIMIPDQNQTQDHSYLLLS